MSNSQADDLRRALAREIRDEISKSPFRDPWCRDRVHPISYDVTQLITSISRRRRNQTPAALDAARRALRRVDTKALRLLVSVVLGDGASSLAMNRRCHRILEYCDALETAMALRDALKGVAH